jgi:hypothetical protein
MNLNLYWGDLHSHCSISYGHGTAEQALTRAMQQLDFCSVTGHAFWPDMPTDTKQYKDIIEYHNQGFATCAKNWEELIRVQEEATVPGHFIAFPSYEWHSREFGDHNIYGIGPNLALQDAPDLPGLRKIARATGSLAIPHHIGYAAGYRGINWKHYSEECSPFAEIYSLHGCSESEDAPYPMLHDMGPRDYGSTAEFGWDAGHQFGIVGGTDHHGAYPGSHGDGLMGVFAKDLTREAIWDAFKERRVYAATGDKIDARLFVDDAWIGSTIKAADKRHINAVVHGIDKLDRVEVLKNGRVIRRIFPEWQGPYDENREYRLRVTWGWGRKNQPIDWNAKLTVENGSIEKLDTCFSGQAVVAPKGDGGHAQEADELDLPHEILEQDETSVTWKSRTTGNLSMRHPRTQALSLAITAKQGGKFTLEVNGEKFTHSVDELLAGGRSHYLRGWLTEAIRIGPLVPKSACNITAAFHDEPEKDIDVYRLRASQVNGQWAWLTPIWVER